MDSDSSADERPPHDTQPTDSEQTTASEPEKIVAPTESDLGDHDNSRKKRLRKLLILAWTRSGLLLIIVSTMIFIRIWLVDNGILYGAASTAKVDDIVAGALAISLALISLMVSRRARLKTGTEPGSRTFTEWVAVLSALVSVVALTGSPLNLFVPVELPSRAKPACPGAQDRVAPYVGITSGAVGDNSRSGPGLSFGANGRFPADCSIGFAAFCFGDQIEDTTGSIKNVQTWVTNRWLIVAKQPAGRRSTIAHDLSGETPDTQFVSDSNITPETSYDQLKPASEQQCAGGGKAPGKVQLHDLDETGDTFTAQADHAVNMGFSVWIPRTTDFIDPDSYHPMFSDGFPPDTNPGATDAGGSKKVTWRYHGQLLPNRAPAGLTGPKPAVVVVMAVPCLGANLPADITTAAVVAYDIGSHSEPAKVANVPTGYDPLRLARAACQANI